MSGANSTVAAPTPEQIQALLATVQNTFGVIMIGSTASTAYVAAHLRDSLRFLNPFQPARCHNASRMDLLQQFPQGSSHYETDGTHFSLPLLDEHVFIIHTGRHCVVCSSVFFEVPPLHV